MHRRHWALLILMALAFAGAEGSAEQRRDRDQGWDQGWDYQRGGGYYRDPRNGVPEWEIDQRFPEDVFTFARVYYEQHPYAYGGGRGRRGRGRRGYGWDTDWPDSDLNFSFRLQQLTTLKVNPDPVVVRLKERKEGEPFDPTEPYLFDYPFIYMIEPGNLHFSDDEVLALRRYLLNGGFMMVDDFWGYDQWDNFVAEMNRVLPNKPMQELDIDHEIFHIVYDLTEKPQVPNIRAGMRSRYSGESFERHSGGEEIVHYKGIFDDKGRMMVIVCHNTDLGDGWEREGEDPWYFENYSEPKAYPMGINIVTYAMTH